MNVESLADYSYLLESLICEARSALACNLCPYLLTICFYQLTNGMPDNTGVGKALDHFLSRHQYV